jgi:hypothetical protein
MSIRFTAALSPSGCNWQFAHEKESRSVKEVYHVAKNSEEIRVRDTAASHGGGICAGGRPDIYRAHRERLRGGTP